MKTIISSTEHILIFAKNTHRYVASIQIVENDVAKPFSMLKLSEMQNALTQSLGYRHLHELNKSLSPAGLSSWADYPKETVFRVKTDFAHRLIKLLARNGEQSTQLLRVLVAGALHREGARGALVDPADSDIKMEMSYDEESDRRSNNGAEIVLAGESGRLMHETMQAIMEVKYEALSLERARLEDKLLASRKRLAETFIHEMRPCGQVTIDVASSWISSHLNPNKPLSDQFVGDFLAVLNMMINERPAASN